MVKTRGGRVTKRISPSRKAGRVPPLSKQATEVLPTRQRQRQGQRQEERRTVEEDVGGTEKEKQREQHAEERPTAKEVVERIEGRRRQDGEQTEGKANDAPRGKEDVEETEIQQQERRKHQQEEGTSRSAVKATVQERQQRQQRQENDTTKDEVEGTDVALDERRQEKAESEETELRQQYRQDKKCETAVEETSVVGDDSCDDDNNNNKSDDDVECRAGTNTTPQATGGVVDQEESSDSPLPKHDAADLEAVHLRGHEDDNSNKVTAPASQRVTSSSSPAEDDTALSVAVTPHAKPGTSDGAVWSGQGKFTNVNGMSPPTWRYWCEMKERQRRLLFPSPNRSPAATTPRLDSKPATSPTDYEQYWVNRKTREEAWGLGYFQRGGYRLFGGGNDEDESGTALEDDYAPEKTKPDIHAINDAGTPEFGSTGTHTPEPEGTPPTHVRQCTATNTPLTTKDAAVTAAPASGGQRRTIERFNTAVLAAGSPREEQSLRVPPWSAAEVSERLQLSGPEVDEDVLVLQRLAEKHSTSGLQRMVQKLCQDRPDLPGSSGKERPKQIMQLLKAGSAPELFKGIHNHGNTCFGSAGLQFLFTPTHWVEDLARAEPQGGASLVMHLRNLAEELPDQSRGRPTKALDLLKQTRFRRYVQQDVGEFMDELIDGMKKEMGNERLQAIQDRYQVSEEIQHTCSCGNITTKPDSGHWRLSLGVQETNSTMQDVFDNNFNGNPLDEYECTSCSGISTTTKKTIIAGDGPRILILHLQRYQRGETKESAAIKLEKAIPLPERICLRDGRLHVLEAPVPARRYVLSSAIKHHDPTSKGGHYTCDAKRTDPKTNETMWVHFDDFIGRRLSKQQVAGLLQGSPDDVMLLYQDEQHATFVEAVPLELPCPEVSEEVLRKALSKALPAVPESEKTLPAGHNMAPPPLESFTAKQISILQEIPSFVDTDTNELALPSNPRDWWEAIRDEITILDLLDLLEHPFTKKEVTPLVKHVRVSRKDTFSMNPSRVHQPIHKGSNLAGKLPSVKLIHADDYCITCKGLLFFNFSDDRLDALFKLVSGIPRIESIAFDCNCQRFSTKDARKEAESPTHYMNADQLDVFDDAVCRAWRNGDLPTKLRFHGFVFSEARLQALIFVNLVKLRRRLLVLDGGINVVVHYNEGSLRILDGLFNNLHSSFSAVLKKSRKESFLNLLRQQAYKHCQLAICIDSASYGMFLEWGVIQPDDMRPVEVEHLCGHVATTEEASSESNLPWAYM